MSAKVKQIIKYPDKDLDTTPRRCRQPSRFKVVWSARTQYVPGRSNLYRLHDKVIFVDGSAEIYSLGFSGPIGRAGEAEKTNSAVISLGAGYGSAPVLVDDKGDIWRVSLDLQPQYLWSEHCPGVELAALGVSDDRVLIRRYDAGTWTIKLVDTSAATSVWSATGGIRLLFVHEDKLVYSPYDPQAMLVCVSIVDGEELWRTRLPCERVTNFISSVENRLWLSDSGGSLLSVTVSDGAVLPGLILPQIKLLLAPVDEQGVLHVCNGLVYVRLDLTTGQIANEYVFEQGDTGPMTQGGFGPYPTADGRLLFFDQRNRLYVWHAETPRRVELLWHAETPVVAAAIGDDLFAVLETNGQLSVLASSG